ncbi:IS1634 family transposase [Mycoavidus sp. HKI]|uniref:IS1634 family transposase n=1 Tax=Mycoavidus sp. HKI TaxID=2840467 RepID=UPI001CBD4F00|nr:IS1634 family transposase [Mycoavidus sp. HKI]UAW63734.1 IS1634 family transposase [Mycoavidus sp. HKI]UAW63870.1 IS1634 family transposase [Mycoavidus sp. HKI]UAW64064.1 IS1634 family transposase [Mycoavidus sp. HKI]UAW64425.1 IS1634 family transposase [Mycoavidus sp. HKI]UAW64894.1 IS1634 family transposase [Mycoavidus sp. HKI]
MGQSAPAIITHVLDHHGLVASKCQDLQLAQRIDKHLTSHPGRIVSYGTACVAMILNGLGFTNRRLYLTPQFFESKPLEALLGSGIEARHLNDDALGDALDAIAQYGPSKLFGEVAFEIALEHDLLDELVHVDTTSFSVHGKYASDEGVSEQREDAGEAVEITVTHGYSKDHRPDLKQVVLSLAVAGGSGIPLWMMPCDGNASDKTVLPETIERINAFRQEIDCTRTLRWVADSALYTAENLKKMEHTIWVSRVPETILEARELVSKSTQEIAWSEQEDGYRHASFDMDYAGIQQRWLLVFSEQAYQREAQSLQKRLTKQEQALQKQMKQFSTELFACEADAHKTFRREQKSHPLFILAPTVAPVEKYEKAGRPKKGETKQCMGYQIQVQIQRNDEAIQKLLQTKGRFILATNEGDKQGYPDKRILADYKAQQTVENGFRFLKNPDFLADTLFLKSPQRIAALMMVMTLCLMVYNLAQFQVRAKLEAYADTLPNQLGKPTSTPTLRWIFQLMEGVALVRIFDHQRALIHEAVSNLNDVRIKIIRLFGDTACKIYQIEERE